MERSNSSSDFVVGNCLGCSGLVRIPVNTKAHVRVRCPRCGEMYLLSEIVDHDIPALEIVDHERSDAAMGESENKYQPVTPKEDGRFVVPGYLAKAAERKSRRKSRSERPGSTVDIQENMDSSSEHSRHRPTRSDRQITSRPRTSRKRNSFDFIMIVLGGLMSIPVAQMMIWWILGTDPLKIAPDVARIVPVVVPSDLREPEDRDTQSPPETRPQK